MECRGYWLVARTKSKQDSWAIENVERQGFTTYRPLIASEPNPKHGQLSLSLKTESLFPGYLFVFTPHGQWQVLLGTFGVIGVVLQGKLPAKLPPVEIDKIRAREGPDGLIALPSVLQASLRPGVGDSVRVKRGPFEGQEGVCAGSRGAERAQVLLSFLGGKVPVLLRDDDLDILR